MLNDVIKQVSQLKNINHVVILTHNIDFLFLQSILLNALKSCGHPSLTVFADAQCVRETFPIQAKLISGLGSRFRVIPVTMHPGYRFHPKAIFLAGDSDATLFVGSGNLTFGGLRQNAEIWKKFDTNAGDFAEINSFRQYLESLTNRVALGDRVRDELFQIYAGNDNEWVNSLAGEGNLISRVSGEPTIFQQIKNALPQQTFTKITVITPYFDEKAEAIIAISESFPSVPINVLIQSKRSTLLKEAADKLPEKISIKNIEFKRENHDSEPFLHAKMFAFFTPDEVWVFAGSANSSKAALLSEGQYGNAEMMAYEAMSHSVFEESVLTEILINDDAPELISKEDLHDENQPNNHGGFITAARFENFKIDVVYKLPQEARITNLLLNDENYEFETTSNNQLVAKSDLKPETIQIIFDHDGLQYKTPLMWVDDEVALSSTSKGRDLLDRVRTHARANKPIQLEDWSLIAELFAKDFSYKTPRELRMQNAGMPRDDSNNTKYVPKQDIFSNSYESMIQTAKPSRLGGEDVNIFALISNVYGKEFQTSEVSVENNSPTQSTHTKGKSDNVLDNEDVDQQENIDITGHVSPPPEEPISKNQIKKAHAAAEAIRLGLTNDELLAIRQPSRLAKDIQIAGLLLRKALSKNWISKEQFFDISLDVWSSLFLTTKNSPGVGWVSLRYRDAHDKDIFIASLRSPELSAVLYVWLKAIDFSKLTDIRSKRFYASVLMSIGRCQWLWYDEIDNEKFFNHLERIYIESPCDESSDFLLGDIQKERLLLLKQATSLARLESVISREGLNPSEIKSILQTRTIEEGELLWQGSKRGLCITAESSYKKENVKCFSLQEANSEVHFRSNLLIPLIDLLHSSILSGTSEFGSEQVSLIENVISLISVT
jgi:HKD family nuclease